MQRWLLLLLLVLLLLLLLLLVLLLILLLLLLLWNNESFLGLGLVSVNELVLDEHQRMVIPLQGNPVLDNPGLGYDNSALFGGLLTVHFLITQTEEKSEAQKVFVQELGQENGETFTSTKIDQEPEPESCKFLKKYLNFPAEKMSTKIAKTR